jgi:hypothetical protein
MTIRAVVGILCLAGVATAADDAVELRYRFRAGESLPTRVAHRALTETTMNGTTQTVETMTDSTKTWKVVAVDDAGRATIDQSVDDVVMTSRTSDRGEVRWRATGDAEPPPGYEAVRASLGKPLVRLVVEADGRVIERRELLPCPPPSTGDLVVVPLPQGRVEVGHEWTVPQELVVEAPGGLRKAVRTRIRYRLSAVADGIATIAVDTTVLTPVDEPQLEARLLERIWNGRIRFDVMAGRIVERTTAIDSRVVGFGGPQSCVRYKASLEERAVDEQRSGD